MANHSNNALIGATGNFYVMARLAYENLHAACTFGNAPNIDILVSSKSGDKSVAIQVKTSAYARRGKGKKENNQKLLDWPISYKSALQKTPNLFFVFVDLWGQNCQTEDGDINKVKFWQPTCYIISSIELSRKCEELGWDSTWWRFQIETDFMEAYKDNWDLIKAELGEPLI